MFEPRHKNIEHLILLKVDKFFFKLVIQISNIIECSVAFRNLRLNSMIANTLSVQLLYNHSRNWKLRPYAYGRLLSGAYLK